MSQLIQLKQRLKAIETIKKITNAMRVISMSMHSKLGNKLEFLENYKNQLNEITFIVKKSCKNITTQNINNKKKLIIIIGSDKGLCGPFNSGILKLIKSENLNNFDILTIGKKITDNLKNKFKIVADFQSLSYKNLNKITSSIFTLIEQDNYSEITCINTKPKNFFSQVPQKNIIFPVENELQGQGINTEEYIWEETPEQIYESLKKEYLKFSISYSLFESLFAEQAARFQSMDNATRSAEKILEDMQIQYSKLRQAKITQEINELTSHF